MPPSFLSLSTLSHSPSISTVTMFLVLLRDPPFTAFHFSTSISWAFFKICEWREWPELKYMGITSLSGKISWWLILLIMCSWMYILVSPGKSVLSSNQILGLGVSSTFSSTFVFSYDFKARMSIGLRLQLFKEYDVQGPTNDADVLPWKITQSLLLAK